FARAVPETGERLANAVAPNRRPRSSMSPTMVVNDANDLVLVTGSPGGNSIPAYVAKTLLGVLDWGMTAQEAADAPNIIARGEKVRVEVGEPGGQAIADGLNEKGYLVQAREGENSGLHLIHINESGLDGAADKRREGVVRQLP
ncbi:MAG: gamma-glutamyltransferase, partial [Pseudomonadales bacterium]